MDQRIIFVNEASSSIGLGHILRSQEIAQEMHTRGYGISGITIGDEVAVLYAKERAKLQQFVWSIQTVCESQAAIEYILHDAPSVIVMDCAKTSQEIVTTCAYFGIHVIALDYYIFEQPLPTVIINLIDRKSDHLTEIYAKKDMSYFAGPHYAIIREEFLEARNRRNLRGERATIKKILISFGGADPSGNSQRALEMITRWPGEFFVDIIIGPLFSSEIKPVIESVSNRCAITLHKSPSHMGVLFEESDLIFCGGGGTLLESLCVGIPTIVIAQNDSELQHAISLMECKACWLSDYADWEFIRHVENRKKRSMSAQACVDGRGVERICDAIEQQLN